MNAHTDHRNMVSHLCVPSCGPVGENYGKMSCHRYHTCKAFLQYGHVCVISSLTAEQRTFHIRYRQMASHPYEASCGPLGLHYRKRFYHTAHTAHVHHSLFLTVAWLVLEWGVARAWVGLAGVGVGGPL